MTFAFEKWDKRYELRQNVAGTLRFYPKVDGVGNVFASQVNGDNNFTIFDFQGAVITPQTSILPTNIPGTPTISAFDVPVPALAVLRENYFCVLNWRQDGGSISYVETIYFDVVLQPWGESQVSLNGLVTRCAPVLERLKRQVQRIDPAGDLHLTVEQLASEYGELAHQRLYRMIRRQVALDTQQSGGIRTRPRLICNRLVFHQAEICFALSAIFFNDITSGDLGSEATQLRDLWEDEGMREFSGVGSLEYDVSEDRIPDTKLESFGRAVKVRRMQG